jgi:hypothetical protein
MTTADLTRRSALRVAAGLLFLPGLTACALSRAGTDAQLIADALDATWRFIVTQVPALAISPATQASLTNAFRAINAGGWELTTQAAASPDAVVDFVKGVNEVITVIVANPAIPLDLAGPAGEPIAAVFAAVVTLMPEVESSFKLAIPIASTQRSPGAAPIPAPPAPHLRPMRKPHATFSRASRQQDSDRCRRGDTHLNI